MRTFTTTLAGVAAGAVLTLSTAGIALAAPAAPTAASPAAVFVSSGSAQPGTTVHVSGTCALPASGAMPTVSSVVSPAFTGPERFSKTDPDAFDGTATIDPAAGPGIYTVTLTCSNSRATTELRVLGSDRPAHNSGHAAAVPLAPARPAGRDNAPAAHDNAPAAHNAPAAGDNSPVVQAQDDPSDQPWLGVGVSVLAIAAAGAAVFVVARSRSWTRV